MNLGAHMSIAGGLHPAGESGRDAGCDVTQMFVGKGAIGLEAFRCLAGDTRFREVPKVIGTPKEDNMDRVDLRILREMSEA